MPAEEPGLALRADAGGAVVWLTQNEIFYHFTRLLRTGDTSDLPVDFGYQNSGQPDSLGGTDGSTRGSLPRARSLPSPHDGHS